MMVMISGHCHGHGGRPIIHYYVLVLNRQYGNSESSNFVHVCYAGGSNHRLGYLNVGIEHTEYGHTSPNDITQ